jgi:hypothetical protein
MFNVLPATAMIPFGAFPLWYPDQITPPVLGAIISGPSIQATASSLAVSLGGAVEFPHGRGARIRRRPEERPLHKSLGDSNLRLRHQACRLDRQRAAYRRTAGPQLVDWLLALR